MDDVDMYDDDLDEPLFADEIEDEDNIPEPPSPINEEEIRRRARQQAALAGRNATDDSLNVPLGENSSTQGHDVSVTEQAAQVIKKRKPLLKFDENRLTGERGLKVLKEEFPKLKFRGKGHEKSDLKLLIKEYEHWAHRLFPKMTFTNILERIEKLQAKGEVKTYLNGLRYGNVMQDRLDDSDNEESDVLFQNNLEIDRTEQRDQLVDEVMEKREDSDDDEAWRMLGQNHLPDKCSLIKVVQPQVDGRMDEDCGDNVMDERGDLPPEGGEVTALCRPEEVDQDARSISGSDGGAVDVLDQTLTETPVGSDSQLPVLKVADNGVQIVSTFGATDHETLTVDMCATVDPEDHHFPADRSNEGSSQDDNFCNLTQADVDNLMNAF